MITCKWKSLVLKEIFISPQSEPTLRIISVGYIRGDVSCFFPAGARRSVFRFLSLNHERFKDQTFKTDSKIPLKTVVLLAIDQSSIIDYHVVLVTEFLMNHSWNIFMVN